MTLSEATSGSEQGPRMDVERENGRLRAANLGRESEEWKVGD